MSPSDINEEQCSMSAHWVDDMHMSTSTPLAWSNHNTRQSRLHDFEIFPTSFDSLGICPE
ncbi:hypothetical protein BGAL_0061g00330 [Botrytis galanthina]|uniref:Uncharacterized protein n=1 Tax=Botrytis galanthina TaxID=278940 RepID=A0A4S8R529_9HELO|nr:hypothetical protein BGAL_0061g00330 [Botrytis galanthina]